MTLFERTKEISKLRGYSLQTVAEKAGLSKNAIYNWKTKEPSEVSLKAVSAVLNVDTDYLLGNTDEMHSAKPTSNTADLAKEGVFLYQGQEISDEQMEILKSIIDSWKKD
ncbi:helix-turn-helix transcriptional regulator [Periweissella fabaria]|uniref:Helix-turn-helix transcriptional regulator n=2 Tax=Periweissella TaxID=2930384 RepID=A0A7X6S206_9LACO|nr:MULTISPECIES: helix-turn-helix transcriptional regulator [Periweissella]MCM0597350.1 helix-turn-helix transcriptional regulator [Periweissella fabaria]MCM0599186.1 helix-turn-helix transcriptional regulator [Periweissella fabalis]NKZ23465.1 helix-turn-helix transcriptional regulator [Periweissella fabalis]CAH0416146.1 hypothetical protein WFA24289_00445 [Periweissella fabaria]